MLPRRPQLRHDTWSVGHADDSEEVARAPVMDSFPTLRELEVEGKPYSLCSLCRTLSIERTGGEDVKHLSRKQ